jgi:Fungal specific transcription factor domain
VAVENPNLLNLLLAYSASHRARLLSHPEPANRIALWVRDVFPDLRHALSNISNAKVSNANLATAIMLASLEIISPSSFGVSIPWQNHLSIARSIIRSRNAPQSISRTDPVLYFLTRWLAYLDVLGSLSGRRNEEPLFAGNYWASNSASDVGSVRSLSLESDMEVEDDDYTIDCLLGFTTRCVQILAQVASLAHACDKHRIDEQTNQVRANWRPSQLILDQADRLKSDLEHARDHEQKSCAHHSPVLSKASLHGGSSSGHYHSHGTQTPNNGLGSLMTPQEANEALLTNSAFHWAGLIHLLRRVHNLPRSDAQVQKAVHELVKIISEIREGGSAEACLLFPMFSAGVEALEMNDRELILKRIKSTEMIGMWQVGRARRIMEEVWRTGGAWETVVGKDGEGGEFFG